MSDKIPGTLLPLFLKLPPQNIVELKFTLESYEGIGILRTINPQTGEVVILAVEDSAVELRAIIDSVSVRLELREIPAPENLDEDWLLDQIADEIPQLSKADR